MASGTITISPKFFRNERRNYSDWGFAFWRELFQNSIDAKARHIHVEMDKTCDTLPNGEERQGVLIHFKDNGCGMNEGIANDVYFHLGETTKGADEDVGGFGKARIVTNFSHHSYGFKSQDIEVVGHGSSYNLTKVDGYVDGCHVWVDVDTSSKYCDVDMGEALMKFLRLSQLNCSLTSNCLDVAGFDEWMYKRTFARKLAFGDVYVNKSGVKGKLVVRVHGVPMFTRDIRAQAQVVLEVDPSKSRDVLLSNRDSLHSDAQNELDSFINEIAANTQSALKPRKPSTNIIGAGDQSCVTVRRNKDKQEVEGAEVGSVSADSIAARLNAPLHARQLLGETSDEHGTPLNELVTDADERRSMLNEALDIAEERRQRQFDPMIPSLVIHTDTENAAIKKAAWLFNPENTDYFGSTKRKLARLWYVAVSFAIEGWLERTKNDSISWRPGFLFSDAQAMCQGVGGMYHILFRPVDDDGKIRFKVRNREDRIKMIVWAAHEVTHLSFDYHDEDFACLKDDLFEYMMIHEREIFKAMNQSLKV